MLTNDRDRRRRRRGGAIRLNQGSSTLGVRRVLPLNQAGGGFGAGRPAGGGGSGGSALMQALAGPAPSVQGPVAEIGPPPVTPTLLPEEQHPFPVPYPTFRERPVDSQSILAALYPSFSPIAYPERRRVGAI